MEQKPWKITQMEYRCAKLQFRILFSFRKLQFRSYFGEIYVYFDYLFSLSLFGDSIFYVFYCTEEENSEESKNRRKLEEKSEKQLLIEENWRILEFQGGENHARIFWEGRVFWCWARGFTLLGVRLVLFFCLCNFGTGRTLHCAPRFMV